jgi:hypothetical protein
VHLFHAASGQRYSRSDRPAATLDRTEDHPS